MIANHKGEIPAFILLLPFLLGTGFGTGLPAIFNFQLLLILFLFSFAAFIALNIFYNPFKLYKARWLGGTLIHIVIFLAGCLLALNYNELRQPDHFSTTPAQALVVRINNEPVFKNGLLRFTASAKGYVKNSKIFPCSGTLLISIKDSRAKDLYYGDDLLVPAKFNAIEPPRTPAAFNYKNYLSRQNIFYQQFLYPRQFVRLDSNRGDPLIAYSLRLRQRLVQKLKLNIRDTNAMAVASTLILGYKADLNPDVLQAYSKTGTVHVLSVSGAHVAIVYVLLSFCLSFLNRFKYGKLLKTSIIISLIWFYALLTGFSPAVCRAALMISMVIVGKTFNRYTNTLNILAISAFALLLYDPFLIADVGFQLSYLAVFGLLAFQPLVYKWFSFKSKWADKLWALCSVSIAAQVITFPLSAFYFHQFPVYFLISNLFIVIPSAIIMYSGIIYLLLPIVPFVSKAAAYVLEHTILIMNNCLAYVEHIPFASIGKIWLTIPEYLLLYVIIICVFCFLNYQSPWLLKVALGSILILCFSISLKKIRLQQADNIAWLNLNKHQGIVFKKGNKAVVIADLKSSDKIFAYSIQPYLDSCQVNNLKVIGLNDNLQNDWFIKRYNLVQFLKQKVFIYDRPIKPSKPAGKITTDYIYLTENKFEALTDINTNFDYHLMLVDGTNSTQRIAKITEQATAAHIKYKILKRNNSFITASNN